MKKESKFKGKVRENARKTARGMQQFGYLNLPKGVNQFFPEPDSRVQLDFLPYRVTEERHPDRDNSAGIAIPGEPWYKRPFMVHRNVGIDNNMVVCPTSIKQRCPICDYRAQRQKEGAEKEELDSMKRSSRDLYAVVPKGHKKYEEEPHVMDMSHFLFQKVLAEELDDPKNEKYEVFFDLESGFTLRIRFTSTTIGKGQAFAETSRIDFEERDTQYSEALLDEVPNLDKMLIILSPGELKKKFFEEEGDDEDSSTEEGKSTEEPEQDAERKPRWGQGSKQSTKESEEEEADASGESERKKTFRKHAPESDGAPTDDEKCPHKHTFGGKDADTHKECDACKLWDACMEAKQSSIAKDRPSGRRK